MMYKLDITKLNTDEMYDMVQELKTMNNKRFAFPEKYSRTNMIITFKYKEDMIEAKLKYL